MDCVSFGGQSGDSGNDLVEEFTAAVVASQRPPVLQVGDAVLYPNATRGVGPALLRNISSHHGGAFFLNLR